MSELVTALAGGAVGSIVTVCARYAAVPAEVRQHDRQIADIDRDLDRYAADESARLMGVIFETRFPGFKPSELSEADIAYECGKLAAWSIQLYRDEETARIRQHRELVASEKWAHRLWRKVNPKRHPPKALQTPETVPDLLDLWVDLVPHAHRVDREGDFDPRHRNIHDMKAMLTEYLSDPRAKMKE